MSNPIPSLKKLNIDVNRENVWEFGTLLSPIMTQHKTRPQQQKQRKREHHFSVVPSFRFLFLNQVSRLQEDILLTPIYTL